MAKFWWFLAALAAMAIGIGLALWRAPQSVSLPAEDGPISGSPPAPMPAPPTLARQAAPAGPAAATAPPPGLNAEQWQSLQRELAGRPEELRRVTAYLGFSDDVARLRTAQGAARKALAAAIDGGIDEHLRQNELSAGEARLIKIAVLQELLPDDPQRQAALQAWETAQRNAARPDAKLAAVAAREAEFQRRQAEIVAAWQAQPSTQRDAQALERELDALRRSSFPTTTTTR